MANQTPHPQDPVDYEKESCTCCMTVSTKVGPQVGSYPGYDIVQVRPKRFIRVKHMNPVARDEAFEREMTLFQQAQGKQTQPKTSYNSFLKSPKRSSSKNVAPMRKQSKDSPPHSRTLQAIPVVSDNLKPNTNGNATPRTATTSSIAVTVDNSDRSPQRSVAGTALRRTVPDTPLFLLHGVGGSADIWQAQMEYFASEGYEVIAPDLIGHGFSNTPDKPSAYHFNEIQEDILILFDMYCKPENIVIGHSYG